MKTQSTTHGRYATAFVCLCLAALCPQIVAAPASAAEPASLLSVTVLKIKPDMVAEYEEMTKSEALPALKRGGLEWRHTWTRGVFGTGFEYHLVSPVKNFAQYDGQSALTKALGEAGARAYFAKASKYTESVRTYAIRSIPSLSWETPMDGAANIAVLTSVTVAHGRRKEFLDYLAKEYVPVIKKSDLVAYWVYETVFGGNSNEIITVAVNKNYADLDKGPAPIRVLGAEGAEKLQGKLPAGVIVNLERSVIRLRADLSILRPSADAKGKASAAATQ